MFDLTEEQYDLIYLDNSLEDLANQPNDRITQRFLAKVQSDLVRLESEIVTVRLSKQRLV